MHKVQDVIQQLCSPMTQTTSWAVVIYRGSAVTLSKRKERKERRLVSKVVDRYPELLDALLHQKQKLHSSSKDNLVQRNRK